MQYECPDSGVVTSKVTIEGTAVSLSEVMLSDCPNGFKFYNGKCLKVLPSNTYGHHTKTCQKLGGTLLQTNLEDGVLKSLDFHFMPANGLTTILMGS